MKINWSLKKAEILNISIRKRCKFLRHNDDEGSDFYAVVSLRNRHRGVMKQITLMCFKNELWMELDRRTGYPEDAPFIFSFCGFVSFGYGNTFLNIEEIYDVLGLPIIQKDKENMEEEEEEYGSQVNHP